VGRAVAPGAGEVLSSPFVEIDHERRVDLVFLLTPDAFGQYEQTRGGSCRHQRFKQRPSSLPYSMEAKSVSGDFRGFRTGMGPARPLPYPDAERD
jgi:hypothetical protein